MALSNIGDNVTTFIKIVQPQLDKKIESYFVWMLSIRCYLSSLSTQWTLRLLPSIKLKLEPNLKPIKAIDLLRQLNRKAF